MLKLKTDSNVKKISLNIELEFNSDSMFEIEEKILEVLKNCKLR